MISVIGSQPIEVLFYYIHSIIDKQSHSKNKENSTDNAISHTSRLIKYQTESMPRPLHHKLQSNNIKLARNDKDISASNKYHTIGFNNIKKTTKANKTAIGTEYNASQNFLKAFPDNIDTHLGIGDVLLNDDSILLTDSNLINDMIPNTTFDSNDLSNAKLNFNEWNLKIMSSNKEGFLQSSSSNSKNKMNEIIANVTPFNDTFQGNKLPVPHYQNIDTIDEERNINLNANANTIKTYANTIPNSMLNSISDRGEIKKISNKIYSKNRNVNKPLQPKPLKTTQNYSFHNDSSSTRTTVGSLNNNKHNNQMIYHKPDHFNTNVNSADLGKVKANYSKEHRMKSKETIEFKSQDTVMKYLKILFGEQLEAFNEKSIFILYII